MKIQLVHRFEDIVSLENLLEAWKEFVKGKRNKKDIQIFSLRLMSNIFSLHNDLIHHTYNHGSYQAFKINDPKPRDVHKATVRDRLLHHAVYRIFCSFFDKTFISDSYSCRNDKGTHKAIDKFHEYFYKVNKNNTKTCYVLKCDIKKFFASINHKILIEILQAYIPDKNIIKLVKMVIESFETNAGKGLPLGNLTSQLFANIYLNKLDQFVKHQLKAKYYIRYADDFIILSEDYKWLKSQVLKINNFLTEELELHLHSNKVFIKTIASGVDFLGIIHFFDHRILRTKTKRKMFKKIFRKNEDLQNKIISKEIFNQGLQSYLGILKHCNGYGITRKLKFFES